MTTEEIQDTFLLSKNNSAPSLSHRPRNNSESSTSPPKSNIIHEKHKRSSLPSTKSTSSKKTKKQNNTTSSSSSSEFSPGRDSTRSESLSPKITTPRINTHTPLSPSKSKTLPLDLKLNNNNNIKQQQQQQQQEEDSTSTKIHLYYEDGYYVPFLPNIDILDSCYKCGKDIKKEMIENIKTMTVQTGIRLLHIKAISKKVPVYRMIFVCLECYRDINETMKNNCAEEIEKHTVDLYTGVLKSMYYAYTMNNIK
jgi:hypothetical protein